MSSPSLREIDQPRCIQHRKCPGQRQLHMGAVGTALYIKVVRLPQTG